MIFVASSSFMRTKYQRTVHIINKIRMKKWAQDGCLIKTIKR